MNKFKILWMFLVGSLLLPLSTFVYASNINDYLGEVTSLSAEFKQVVKSEQTELNETTYGEIVVNSPSSFRLTYTKPYKLIYVANGTVIWTYDEDLEQASVREQGELIASSPAAVLSNPSKIEQAYKVKYVGEEEGSDLFVLTPISPDGNYKFIELGFRDDAMYYMRMVDGLGQETILTFNNVTYNPELELGIFDFVPPSGVDVIKNN